MPKLISGTLSPADVQSILDALALIRAKMPFLVDLSPAQRRALPKMGDKGRAFVQKGLEVAAANVAMLPRNFDLQEFQQGVALFHALTQVALALRQLDELVDDSMLAAGSEAYQSALKVYRVAKMADPGQGLDHSITDLGKSYPRRRRTAKTPTPETSFEDMGTLPQ